MKHYYEIFHTLLQINNHRFGMIIQMMASCVIYNLASLLPPIATAGIIAMITDNDFNGIWYYAGVYLIFYALYFGALAWNYHTYTILADHYHLEVQKQLFEKIASDDAILRKMSRGKLIDTSSDDIRYLVDVINCATEAIASVVKLIIIFIVFVSYNLWVALFALALEIVYLMLMNDNSRKISKHYAGVRKNEDKIIDIFNQILSNLRQVTTLHLSDNLESNIDRHRKVWHAEYHKRRFYTTLHYAVIPYLVYFGKIVLYILLAVLVFEGSMTLDRLVLLISYYEMVITCTDTMLDYLLNLSNYGVRVERIKAILDYTPMRQPSFGDVDVDNIDGVVEFKDVCFEADHKLILDHVSFKAKPRQITAVVGRSGAGKTTVINLLYRLGRIKSGEILIDQENIYNYTQEVYATNVAGVYQHPFMFDMSIRENLSLVNADHNAQIVACKRVGIHDRISSLPRGYSTIMSSEESVFTEVEKQLLMIARALLSGSEILLLDEVTASIDPADVSIINTLLQDLKSDHTIILVTHKPELMASADQVVLLDQGKVSDKGTSKGVYKRSSLYRDLFDHIVVSPDKEDER